MCTYCLWVLDKLNCYQYVQCQTQNEIVIPHMHQMN